LLFTRKIIINAKITNPVSRPNGPFSSTQFLQVHIKTVTMYVTVNTKMFHQKFVGVY